MIIIMLIQADRSLRRTFYTSPLVALKLCNLLWCSVYLGALCKLDRKRIISTRVSFFFYNHVKTRMISSSLVIYACSDVETASQKAYTYTLVRSASRQVMVRSGSLPGSAKQTLITRAPGGSSRLNLSASRVMAPGNR